MGEPTGHRAASMAEVIDKARTTALADEPRLKVVGELAAERNCLILQSGGFPGDFCDLPLWFTGRSGNHANPGEAITASGRLKLDSRGELRIAVTFVTAHADRGVWTSWLEEQARRLADQAQEPALSDRADEALAADSQRIVFAGKDSIHAYKDVLGTDSRLQGNIPAQGLSLQGSQAAEDLIGFLSATQPADTDLVLLARGGGSRRDLALFDRADVCTAIAHCRVPVFLAVGHQSDETLANQVASRSFATPSAMGRYLASRGHRAGAPAWAKKDREIINLRTQLGTSETARQESNSELQTARAEAAADRAQVRRELEAERAAKVRAELRAQVASRALEQATNDARDEARNTRNLALAAVSRQIQRNALLVSTGVAISGGVVLWRHRSPDDPWYELGAALIILAFWACISCLHGCGQITGNPDSASLHRALRARTPLQLRRNVARLNRRESARRRNPSAGRSS